MRYLFLLMLCMSAMADDTGLYYDKANPGEGISLVRYGDMVQFTLFTYGNQQCGYNRSNEGYVYECNSDRIRWFITNGDELVGNAAFGLLYAPIELGTPVEIVGLYFLERSGVGWKMVVVPFGNPLGDDDPLYSTVYDWQTLLLRPDE